MSDLNWWRNKIKFCRKWLGNLRVEIIIWWGSYYLFLPVVTSNWGHSGKGWVQYSQASLTVIAHWTLDQKVLEKFLTLLSKNKGGKMFYLIKYDPNPKWCGLLGGVLFGEMKFVLSIFLSNEDLSISYKSWDVQLTFDNLINAFRFKA